jgi:hypothetical protein
MFKNTTAKLNQLEKYFVKINGMWMTVMMIRRDV